MLDVIVFAPHPDDAELGCGGAIVKGTQMGLSFGIIDLTAGEMGTWGDAETRLKEAEKAREIMGVKIRENLRFPDAFLEVNKETVLAVANKIRQYRPKIILAPYWEDRHPDHVATSLIVTKAYHYAKLRKIKLDFPEYRAKQLIYYELNQPFTPSFIMDISDVFEKKMEAIMAYKSQFKRFVENPNDKSKSYIRFRFFKKSMYYGSLIGAAYGEPFLLKTPLKLRDWNALL